MELESSAIAGILIPDILTPGQYYDGVRADSDCVRPIRRLMLAVLADAIRCYQTYANPHNRAQRRLFVEAEAWLMDSKADGPFAFETICDTLDVDPSCLREGLRRWRLQELDGTNGRRLTRRSPVTGLGRIGAPRKRRQRKSPKEAGRHEADLVADSTLAVAIDGSGNDVAYPEGAIVPEDHGYVGRSEIETINRAADIDDADENELSWVAVP
ncbi:MAG TPA: hypothetical protein VKT12_06380, partial [Candidatus Binataceae bacterium]|nr:hypothetical protein [Candidatus Binataceae bacterium]